MFSRDDRGSLRPSLRGWKGMAMPIGVTEDHEELRQVVRRWTEAHCAPAVPRALLDATSEERPGFWESLAEAQWLGLHIPEGLGGAGYGLPELAVVLEELGRACAPGPFLASALAGAVISAAVGAGAAGAGDAGAGAAGLLAGIVSGEVVGAVALGPALDAVPGGDGLRVSGTLRPVLSGHLADAIVAPARIAGGEEMWCVLDRDAGGIEVVELPSVDRTRRSAAVTFDGVEVAAGRVLGSIDRDRVEQIAVVLASAEAVGVAQWCVETAAEYAKVRVQFGRPIGQFQGVKHRSALALARTELARAAAWDAARAIGDDDNGGALAVAAAGALALDAGVEAAKDCVQTLGGIGFTWEHDAHVYLRRAVTLHQLFGLPSRWRLRAAKEGLAGARRRLTVELPAEAEALREEVQAFVAEVEALDPAERPRRFAEAGYVVPGWPKPWGREASALEQLVIAEEFKAAGVQPPSIIIGGWALPTVIVYGTEEQQQRWIPPTLRGEIQWCQLFSEPGAGSDLASLSMRATRADGGWILDGQKVWTSLAQFADWGICLARTDPDVPKHAGISCFMVDMHSPGIEIRPLRELTGATMFNEVFFDGVFVPDDCVVGDVNDGWRAARTTLANERVFMGSGATLGLAVEGLMHLAEARGLTGDSLVLDEIGAVASTGHALAVLGFRLTLQALAGANPSGSEAAVRKLLGVEQDQRVQEVGIRLLGPDAAIDEGEGGEWTRNFLSNRSLSIAGGTSDVQKNVIAERLLGLPRDP